jgi:hypothetical protein
MRYLYLLLIFFAPYCTAQIIIYEGSVSFKAIIPPSNNLNHILLKEIMPQYMNEQKVLIIQNKMAYSYSRPSQKTPSISGEGRYKWINYQANFSYTHKQGNSTQPSLDIVATNQQKTICGYLCKMYYNVYDYKGKTDTCFFWITDKLPNNISPSDIFKNNQQIKGAVLAEKSPFFNWEAVFVKKCDKIDKKLFDWSLHPDNINSEQLKKYISCPF